MADISLRRVDHATARPELIVIFVHGLGGDPVATWCHKGGEKDGYFWPHGIAQKIETCAVFTLGYPANKMVWNTGWPVAAAANSVLDKLLSSQDLRACGDAPIVFVCHSLGGLIIKKLVVTAHLDRQQQPAKGKFLDRIAGVAFLATPHTGSIIANIAEVAHWFVSSSVNDLKSSDAALLDLSHSYRERIANGEARIRHRVYYEMVGKWGAKIVSPASADPGLPGARPVPVNRDHITICKPPGEDDPVYEGVLAFLQDEVLQPRTPSQGEKIDSLPDAIAEKLVAVLEQREETRAAQLAGIERFAIMQLAKRIGAHVSEFDQALLELERAVEIAIRVQQEGARSSNSGDFVDEVLRRVAELSAKGLHEDAGAAADKAFAQWEQEEAGRREAAQQSGIKILDAAINQSLLRRDPAAAAERIVCKCDLEAGESQARFSAGCNAMREWYERGRDKGLNLDLEVAIAIGEINRLRAQDREQRGVALNDLGVALRTLGERESGTARLEAAVTVCQAALAERMRDRVPLDWAAAQNNLGSALHTLGARESGASRLEEAVTAYCLALEEWTRDRVPLDWAMTQNNLGNALHSLGQRESGTVRLEAAVAAYCLALEEWSRDRVPQSWASTQNNLGNALRTLGQRESGNENQLLRLEAAVTAYRLALEEWTRDRVPLQWAGTQNNLGTALRILGLLASGKENQLQYLEEAVKAFCSALEESTRDRVPFRWAGTQNNLGSALWILASLESGKENQLRCLEEAVAAYSLALEESTRCRVPLQWAMTQENMAGVFFALFEKSGDAGHLDKALAAADEALAVYREGETAFYIEKAERLQAEILSARGEA